MIINRKGKPKRTLRESVKRGALISGGVSAVVGTSKLAFKTSSLKYLTTGLIGLNVGVPVIRGAVLGGTLAATTYGLNRLISNKKRKRK